MKLLYTGLDVLAFYLFICNLFRCKKSKYILAVHGLIAAIGIWGINMFDNIWLNFCCVPLVFIFFTLLTFQISVYRAVIYTLIYHIIFACGRELAFVLLHQFLMSLFPEACERFFSIGSFSFLTIDCVFFFCFLFGLGRYTKQLELPESSQGDWCLLIMPIASVIILLCFACLEFPDKMILQFLVCGGSFLLYFANAVIFVILAHFTVAMNQAKMAELSLLKQDLDKVNFDNMEKLNAAYRRYMHDIHHYFYQIRNLAMEGENQSIMEMIDQVEGQIKAEADKRIYVGNRILNSIFVVCGQKAKEYGVALSVEAEANIDMTFIRDVDIISMFGNILDNAIEAAAKCEEGKREVQVRLFMGSRHILYFEVRNTWNGVLKREDQRLLSTKKDTGNHGLGVEIIKELACKYGGDFEMTEKDEWFVTVLYLGGCKK